MSALNEKELKLDFGEFQKLKSFCSIFAQEKFLNYFTTKLSVEIIEINYIYKVTIKLEYFFI